MLIGLFGNDLLVPYDDCVGFLFCFKPGWFGKDFFLLFSECLYIGLALAMQHWLLLVGSLAMPKQVQFVVP